MRSYLPDYDLRAPDTLAEALALLLGDPGVWRPFAGGTDLMVLLEAGTLPEGPYLGLWNLQELKGIEDTVQRTQSAARSVLDLSGDLSTRKNELDAAVAALFETARRQEQAHQQFADLSKQGARKSA